MRNDLPYFSHDNNAGLHPKMGALIAEYGVAGYGMFWLLNETIARSEGAFIDVSKKINKANLSNILRIDLKELDKFLVYLSDPEIDLINYNDGKITTDRITELHKKAVAKRKKQRKDENEEIVDDFDKIDGENEEIVDDFDKIDGENEEIVDDFDTEENRIEENKNRQEENKKEPAFLQSLELSTLLLNSHRLVIPDYLVGKDDKKTIERWAKDIEKLIRIDKKSPENIRQVILYVKTQGNFWFPNIESGFKLREKYEKIWAQYLNSKNNMPTIKHKISADQIPPDKIMQYFKES